MAQDTDQIIIAGNGEVKIANVGATLPTSPSAPYPSGWFDLGYVSEDGVTVVDAKTMFEVPVWQLFYAARRGVEARDFRVQFVMRQWSRVNFVFAMGGASVTTVTGSDPGYKMTPPEPDFVDDRALGIDWHDGNKDYRLILPRGMVTEDVEFQLVRSAAADLPITFSIIGEDGVDPWIGYTNDPAFAP